MSRHLASNNYQSSIIKDHNLLEAFEMTSGNFLKVLEASELASGNFLNSWKNPTNLWKFPQVLEASELSSGNFLNSWKNPDCPLEISSSPGSIRTNLWKFPQILEASQVISEIY